MKRYLIVCLILLGIMGCDRFREREQTVKNPEEITVTVSPVEKKTLVDRIKITGDIIPLYEVEVFPRVNGIVVAENVSLGRRVEKGTVLAQVLQDIPGMEFSPVKILSTTRGTITLDNVEIGATVSTEQIIYMVSQLEQVYMHARVTEPSLGKMKVGGITFVETAAYPGRKFSGEITEISPVVDPRSRMGTVKIRIDNRNGLLKPGMYVWSKIVTGFRHGLVVPLDAVVPGETGHYVYRVEYGRVRRIPVNIDHPTNQYVKIEGNLSESDEVVTTGQGFITDGTLVKVVRSGD